MNVEVSQQENTETRPAPKTPRALHATLDYDALSAELHRLEQAYPDFVSRKTLTMTREGRAVWLMTVGDRRPDPTRALDEADPTALRPAMYVDGNIHATELTGSTACLRLLHDLCEGSATPEGAALLRRCTFYIVPRVSPDGAEHYLKTGQILRSAPVLYPHVSWPPGLHAQDLDGDGRVYQMRQQDAGGGWRVSKEDSRVMVARTFSDVEGPFYHVFPEGMIHEFDGHTVERAPSPFGMDYNRSFPSTWKGEHEQSGASRMPLEHPETRAVAEAILARPNIGLFLALHTGIEVLVPPEGAKAFSEFGETDRAMLQQLARPGVDLLQMPFESLFPVDYGKIYGDFGEWLYDHFGIPGFVAELWAPSARAGISLKDQLHARMGLQDAEKMDLAVARWYDAQGIEGEVREWKAFDHPQLGPVELGGTRMGSWSQAPDGVVLESIAERVSRYARLLANALPQLTLQAPTAQHLGDTLWKVGLSVANAGFLDSNLSQAGLEKQVTRPVTVALEMPPGLERIQGLERQVLGHLPGYSTGKRAEWVIRAESGTQVTLRVDGHRAGQLRTTIPLTLPR